MKTADALKQLSDKHRAYLETLKENMRKTEGIAEYSSYRNEIKATARGYIRCLVDCGVIDDFKPIWIWFTL